jgi:serine/threonine protein phosphatase 1
LARASGQDDVFATLSSARRVWAVASVHGEIDKLTRLARELERRFLPGDRLVFLGNVVGLGTGVVETIDEILRLRRVLLARPGFEPWDFAFLRGAQEEMWQKLLQLHYAVGPLEVFDWMLRQGIEPTLRAYGGHPDQARATLRQGAQAIARWTAGLREAIRARPGHEDFYAAIRRAAITEDRSLLFVNAGLDPARPLDSQGDAFWWGGPGFGDLSGPFESFRLVVRGFDRAMGGVAVGAHKASIDAGAGRGGPLIAGCFDRAGAALDWIEG